MSNWQATLDALMRDRGRQLYGYAYALTENRDAAEALLSESLFATFRRGSGPATLEEADAQVRETMRGLAPEDRMHANLNSADGERTQQLIDEGVDLLGSRDMTDRIWPVTHRVRKDRRGVVLKWSAAAVAGVAAVAVAASLLARDPAPEPTASGVVVPAGTLDATYLIGESSNKVRSSTYSGPTGLRCEVGADNPHLDPAAGTVLTYECGSVWLSSELVLLFTTEITVNADAGTITMDWTIENDSYPVLVDRAGIIGVLTTGSDGFAADVVTTETTFAATTTWASDSTELGVLNSHEDLLVITGEPLTGSVTWTASDGDLVDRVVAGDSPFHVGLQVRIGPRSGESTTELLVSLSDENQYNVVGGAVEGATATA